jgi:hypothetical protein
MSGVFMSLTLQAISVAGKSASANPCGIIAWYGFSHRVEVEDLVENKEEQVPLRWLLFIYRVPQEPAGRRTHVWRALRQLGAIYLQQAAVIVPDQPELRAALNRLAAQVREFNGEASLLETVSPDPGWEQHVIEQFNQARAKEYAEVVENLERFEDEVRRETRKNKFTFAELEDLESDWEKLQRWHERVQARDFFQSPQRLEIVDPLDRARTLLGSFSGTVYSHEGAEAPNLPKQDETPK